MRLLHYNSTLFYKISPLIILLAQLRMKTYQSTQVIGAPIWQALLSGQESLYVVDDVDVELQAFGGPGAYYLVLSAYDAAAESVVEYTFLPQVEGAFEQAAGLTLDLLKAHDYNLVNLLAWLAQGDFQETGVGHAVLVGDLAISRVVLRQKAA